MSGFEHAPWTPDLAAGLGQPGSEAVEFPQYTDAEWAALWNPDGPVYFDGQPGYVKPLDPGEQAPQGWVTVG